MNEGDPGPVDTRRERALFKVMAATLCVVVITGAHIELAALGALLALVAVAYVIQSVPGPRHIRRAATERPIVLANLVLLLALGAISYGYLWINRSPAHAVTISTGLDHPVPLIPAFAVPYVSFRSFAAFTIAVVALQARHRQLRTLLGALVVTVGACAAESAAFPTTVPHATPGGSGVAAAILRFGSTEAAYHRMPSVVVAVGTLCILAWTRLAVARWRRLAVGWALAVILSVMLTRQQSVIGVLQGITLAVTAYWATRSVTERRSRASDAQPAVASLGPGERPRLVLLRSS